MYSIRFTRMILCLFFVLAGSTIEVAGQDVGKSVVRIDTRGNTRAESTSGYGVAWGQTDNIITVLHLVSGKGSNITVSKYDGATSTAIVVGVNKKADLALLRLNSHLGIPGLPVYNADLPEGVDFDFWEIEHGSTERKNKTIKLNTDAGSIPLSDFSKRTQKDKAGFEKSLCSDGGGSYFPAFDMQIFKFEVEHKGKVKNSHSGSPITYGNQIVGLIDGGINGVRPLRWAINAAEEFNAINPGPAGFPICSSQHLYGGVREDNPLLYTTDDGETIPSTLYLSFSVTIGDLYQILSEDALADVNSSLSIDDEVSLNDLFYEQIDIYEDLETGAVVAVPARSQFEFTQFSAGSFMAEVSEADLGDVEMTVQIEKNDSEAESREAIAWFKNYITIVGDKDTQRWQEDVSFGETLDWLSDEDEPYYESNHSWDHFRLNDQREFVDDDGMIFASITIDNYNFLGTSIANDGNLYGLSKAKRIQYYLMEACIALSGFAY